MLPSPTAAATRLSSAISRGEANWLPLRPTARLNLLATIGANYRPDEASHVTWQAPRWPHVRLTNSGPEGRPAVHETWRSDYTLQLARERAEAARARTRTLAQDEEPPRPLDRARWLGVQLRSLLALVAVVEEGSFVGAAKRLGYSRSTISHQIAQLESAVGVPLVVRGSGSRSVTVTPAGGVVVAHGRAVLKLLESAESKVAALGRDVRAPARLRLLGSLAPQ
jgi:molybdenum-dependent DNA-binding transcriptional regulator ModE